MAHIATAPRGIIFRPDILAAIALAGVLGFTFGQNWSSPTSSNVAASAPLSEDWHGNVRRSHWSPHGVTPSP
ncbi:hypothetical protein [Ruegeria meonggei]|uniref:hypothetical protein n=1 Tax=Ruegeria meonggei TaxID=1446476 RepID=UPI00366A6940